MKQSIRCAIDVRIVCWSHDERRVLVSIDGGKHQWIEVEYIVIDGERSARGFINVKGEKICVFA